MSKAWSIRWIAAPTRFTSFSAWRGWRWTNEDVHSLKINTRTVFSETHDPRCEPPGFLDPGFVLFDGDDKPVCALGRHPKLGEVNKTSQTFLVPSGRAWKQKGLIATTEEGFSLTDLKGVLHAQRLIPGRIHQSPLDRRETLVIEGSRWRPREVRERWGFLNLLRGYRCTGVTLVGEDGSSLVEAKTNGIKAWSGDVSHPLTVDWMRPPSVWEQGAVLALVAAMIDATACNPTDQ